MASMLIGRAGFISYVSRKWGMKRYSLSDFAVRRHHTQTGNAIPSFVSIQALQKFQLPRTNLLDVCMCG